jgi:HD-like signal output (HDOD) protein
LTVLKLGRGDPILVQKSAAREVSMAPASQPPPDRQASNDPVLDAILELVTRDEVKVPPIPAVVTKLSEQLKSADFDLREVTQMVGTDQALSAHILRCASSTLLAARGQVSSLNEAVMRVGTNGLFALAVSFCLGRDASRNSPMQALRRDLFRKASATAEFARRLAPRHGIDPDGAFLCGLLASFGLTVALGAIEQVLAAKRVKQSRPAKVWMEMAQRCDQESAASVAAKWGMPKLVTDVVTARRTGEVEPAQAPFVAVLDQAERMTELFYREAAPSQQEIALVLGCDSGMAAEIARFLPEVAASVCALGSAADEQSRTQSAPIPLIEAPPTTLRGEVVPASIPISVERKSGDEQLVCVGLAADGFVAHGVQPLPLNQVVKCRMLGVDEDLELVAFVAGVARNDSEYRFEMKPMGLVAGHAARWQRLRLESAKQFSMDDVLEQEAAAAPPAPEPPPPETSEELEFGPLQPSAPSEEAEIETRGTSEPGAAASSASAGGPSGVSVHGRRNVFRRFADWINGNDIE